jgi:hypothetical protein
MISIINISVMFSHINLFLTNVSLSVKQIMRNTITPIYGSTSQLGIFCWYLYFSSLQLYALWSDSLNHVKFLISMGMWIVKIISIRKITASWGPPVLLHLVVLYMFSFKFVEVGFMYWHLIMYDVWLCACIDIILTMKEIILNENFRYLSTRHCRNFHSLESKILILERLPTFHYPNGTNIGIVLKWYVCESRSFFIQLIVGIVISDIYLAYGSLGKNFFLAILFPKDRQLFLLSWLHCPYRCGHHILLHFLFTIAIKILCQKDGRFEKIISRRSLSYQ